MKALRNEMRVRIVKLLSLSKEDLCVCSIVDILKVNTYTISKHLRELKLVGILTERHSGKYVYYSLCSKNDNFVRNFVKLIDQVEDEYLQKRNIKIKHLLKTSKNKKYSIK